MSTIKIDVTQSVTSRLGFEPLEVYNNMCLGYLTKVAVETLESKADGKWEFAGLTLPRIVLEFHQLKDVHNNKDRFLVHSELPLTVTKANGEERTTENIEKSYIELWRRLKHIHDAYATSPNYKPMDIEPEFNPDLPAEDRIKEFEVFFKAVEQAFMVGADGKTPIFEPYGTSKELNLVTMKLVASGQKGNYLAFPTFVGKGFIEKTVRGNGGKIDTALKFTGSETPIVGQVGIAPKAAASQGDDLPEDVRKILEGKSA